MLENRGAALTVLGIGAGLMYFLDPDRGRRRRALMRDRVAHATTVASDAAGATGRDVAHRASGAAARLRGGRRRQPVDDRVLLERVRAQLGRVVSHPRAIDVDVVAGTVTLRGPVLQAEVPRLMRAVQRVSGVQEVVNQLDVHKESGNVPALQGGSRPRGLHWQREWSPVTRLLTGTTGLTLAGYGAARRDLPGALLATAGIGLLTRAATNLEVRRLTGIGGGRRAVEVQKTISIDVPAEDVFAFWAAYENFPRFMSRVLEVRPSSRQNQSHWTVAGPGGMPVEFDAEVSAFTPNEMLGWRTVEGSTVRHSGLVRFEPAGPGRTRVHVRMSYNPPGGWIGHGVAAAFGVDPKQSLDADLARMKTLLETGRPSHDAAERRPH